MSSVTGAIQLLSALKWRKYLPKNRAQKNIVLAVFLGSGGSIVALLIQKFLKKKQHREELITTTKKVQRSKHQVDALFFHRLVHIIKILVPSIRSVEFIHICVLTFFLFARTVLSIQIADITGLNAQYLVQKRWKDTIRGVLYFAAIGIPASCVNSGLRYETGILALRFRKRLSEHVNKEYLRGVNFYKAAYLGGDNKIDNADQRVTADIEKFCDGLSNLYTTIFKPTLDVILFTRKLNQVMGFRGPLLLYAYYVFSGILKRYIMPAFGRLTARESELEGDYRMAHQRLITNAEEIAFFDGSKKERNIITRLFNEIYTHSKHVQWLKALVGVFDNFLVKYGTSITGYAILALPIYFPSKDGKESVSELTNSYVRNRQLLINLGTAIAQLVVLANKVTSLAGLTARVSELLEMVQNLDEMGNKPFTIRDEPEETRETWQEAFNVQEFLEQWRLAGNRIREQRILASPGLNSSFISSRSSEGGTITIGNEIKFENVSIVSPDGKLLVKDLNFEVGLHQNVMVTGPNGSGKSSLFRILGELWPVHCGNVVKPRKEDMLFVPQKPYLVLGTLRDQIIYPHSVEDMKKLGITDDDLSKLLEIVDPTRTILKQWAFDEVRDWFNAFSGGQKQRVAMARLFYHRPLYAILDECTSAVSDEVEGKIYETCKQLGITLFTVSHRPQLKRYHDFILRFDGRSKWTWMTVDHSDEQKQ